MTKKIIQKIPLSDWAKRHFKQAPHVNTLRKWASTGLIQPAPVKTGRAYMVLPDAVYTPPKASK